MQNKNIEDLTHELLKQIGENPLREGLVRTPSRVAKAWEFFSKGYNQDIESIINNAIFIEEAKENPPDVVGLSIYYWNMALSQYVVKKLREMFKNNVKIILGGPSIDSDKKEQYKFLSKTGNG